MPGSSAPPVFVCVNSRAGVHADDVADRVRALFRDRQREIEIVPFDTSRGSVGRNIPSRSTIVAAGGDGTVSAIAALAIETSSTLGVLPLGTLNHFARDLGIPTDLEKAVDLVVSASTAAVDIGFVNDRLFVNNCSLGVYPTVVAAREQLRRYGHRKWSAMLIAIARVLPRHHRLIVKLDADGEPAVWRTPFVLIANNAYETSGLGFGARKSLQGSRLFAYVAPAIRAHQLPVAAAKAIVAGALGRKRTAGAHFEEVAACQLWIDATGPRRVTVAIDGELSTISLPAHFRVAPRALRVIAPPADEGPR